MVDLVDDNPNGLPFGFGPSGRTSEHATIAINSNLDVLVAFNTDRNDLGPPPLGSDPDGLTGLKQVEVAFYEYIPGTDTWEYRDTSLVGSVAYNPLNVFFGTTTVATRCERPDVIAVQDKFFVTWTRTYDESISGAEDAPAVYECAWIEIVLGSTSKEMEIYGDPAFSGQGHALDFHTNPALGGADLLVRECLGTPDAVYLNDTNDPYKVAVVYAHQTDFSETTPGDETRSCELRIVTCSFDDTSKMITSETPARIVPLIPFNGENTSKGFILPDLAPSGEQNALWLTFEAQKDNNGRDGAIGIGYLKFGSTSWDLLAYRTFFGDNLLRRRPMVSSYPETSSGPQGASLTFSKVDPTAVPGVSDASANVFVKSLTYDSGSIQLSATPYFDWPNTSSLSDAKGVVVSGRSTPGIKYCLADELAAPTQSADCKIQAWNRVSGTMDTLYSFTPGLASDALGRPAGAYAYYPPSAGIFVPDYIAVCFEKSEGGAPLRVYFGVMD